MNKKKQIQKLTIFFLFLFVPFWGISQDGQNNLLSKAIQLFDKEQFKESEPIFRKLLEMRPNDFMLNYFYGASRTENGHFSETDLGLLEKASKEVTPLNIDYYLGLQHHAQKNWEKALKHYNQYQVKAGVSEDEKAALAEKIQQCYDHINPFEVEVVAPLFFESEKIKTEISTPNSILGSVDSGIKIDSIYFLDSTKTDSSQADSTAAMETIEATKAAVTEIENGPRINFIVNNEITYQALSNFQNEKGKQFFEMGNKKSKELERAMFSTKNLREMYITARSRTMKDSIGQQILRLENLVYELRDSAHHYHLQAKQLENDYWQGATEQEIEWFLNSARKNPEPAPKTYENFTGTASTNARIDPEILLATVETEDPTDENTTDELFYKIQIGAYSRGVPNYKKKLHDKLSLLRKIDTYTDENGVVVYTTGNLTDYEDAQKMQKQVRQEGIEDAYVVPYFKGKRITLEQALEIEEKQ